MGRNCMNLKEIVSQQTTSKAQKFWNSSNSYYNKDYTTKKDFIEKFLTIISSSQVGAIEDLWAKAKEMNVVDCFELSTFLLFKSIGKRSYENYKVSGVDLDFYHSMTEPLKVYSVLLKIQKEDKNFVFFNKKENLEFIKSQCLQLINSDNVIEYIALNKKGHLEKIPNLFKHINGTNLSKSKKSLNIAISILAYNQDAKILPKIADIYSFVRKNDPTLSNVKIALLEKELEKGASIYPQEMIDKINKILHDQTIFEDIEKTFSVCVDIEKLTLIRKEVSDYHYNNSGADFVLKISEIIEKAKPLDIFLFKDYVSPKIILDKIDFLSKGKTSQSKLHAEIVRRFEFVYENESDLEAKKEAIKSFLTATSKFPSNSKDSVYIDLMKDISFKFKLEQQIAEPVQKDELIAKKRSKI